LGSETEVFSSSPPVLGSSTRGSLMRVLSLEKALSPSQLRTVGVTSMSSQRLGSPGLAFALATYGICDGVHDWKTKLNNDNYYGTREHLKTTQNALMIKKVNSLCFRPPPTIARSRAGCRPAALLPACPLDGCAG